MIFVRTVKNPGDGDSEREGRQSRRASTEASHWPSVELLVHSSTSYSVMVHRWRDSFSVMPRHLLQDWAWLLLCLRAEGHHEVREHSASAIFTILIGESRMLT